MPPFRVGKPRCKVENVADVTYPAGANNIAFSNVVYDDLGLWDGSGYTFERPGLWLVACQVQRRPTASSSQITVRVWIDGASADSIVGPSSQLGFTQGITTLIEVQPGERLSINATMHGTLASDLGFSQSFLAFTRVGPERWTG